MINTDKLLITSALPYANGPLHIGHLAGAYLNADIFARFSRLMGKDILFVCGSDEHGAAITMRAKKEGVQPQEIIDKYHIQFKDTFQKVGISFDIFHRTSSELHHKTSQDFFRILYRKGVFEKQETEQYFDEEAQQFLADRYIKGECPNCHYMEAYGDQCEQCGTTLSPIDLIHPISTLTGTKPILKKTTHWYLPLDKDATWLEDFIKKGLLDGEQHHNPEDWKPHVLGQCLSWIEGGLQARAMTRDLEWGVDVPAEIPESQGKKLYVWLDAPIGYISATKQWAADNNERWEAWWQDEKTSLIHFIGKDNIVFHCLIFPSILKAHGGFSLPINVPANQFMNLEGKKISTSRNWAVWVHEYLEDFEGKEDALRYSLTNNMPENKDSEFTWKGFQDHNNNELVNNLANFVNRVIVLVNKYYDGIVPEFDPDEMINASDEPDSTSYHDSELLHLFDLMQEVCHHLRNFEFKAGLQAMMEISRTGNQLLQFNEPWKQYETEPEVVKVVLNLAIQYVYALALTTRPFMPHTSDKLCTLLNQKKLQETGELLEILDALAEGQSPILVGHQIAEPIHLFERITDDVIETQMHKLHRTEIENSETMQKDSPFQAPKTEISYDEFTKLDLRIGKVIEAEKIEKSDKLLKLKIDLGFEERTVVSGISKFYSPDDIIGQSVMVLINLAPRKIMGVQSQGMILMAENLEGELGFMAPTKEFSPGNSIS